jgi:hypothetical protein
MNPDHDGLAEEPRRDSKLGAALAALPQPELPGDVDARLRATIEMELRRRRGRRSVAALALAAALAALALGGAALAGAFDKDSPAPWPKPPLPAESVYPTNAAGQTYGGDKPLVEAPDLVKVLATNGKVGYVLQADLNGPMPKTPEEAVASNEASLRGYTIPVYESDGTTQIGVFQVGGAGSKAGGTMADGTTISETADAKGNIITTRVAPDGTTTIETKALDGTVTTKTLSAAEAKLLKENTATPAPSPTTSPEPDRPQAWLLEHMTQAARNAGDAHAIAHWELQWRYLAASIEGKKAPKSPYEKWTSVWIVILHGDFKDGAWMYELLERDSHNVLSEGSSDRPFDTSGLPPLQGPITLGGG